MTTNLKVKLLSNEQQIIVNYTKYITVILLQLRTTYAPVNLKLPLNVNASYTNNLCQMLKLPSSAKMRPRTDKLNVNPTLIHKEVKAWFSEGWKLSAHSLPRTTLSRIWKSSFKEVKSSVHLTPQGNTIKSWWIWGDYFSFPPGMPGVWGGGGGVGQITGALWRYYNENKGI